MAWTDLPTDDGSLVGGASNCNHSATINLTPGYLMTTPQTVDLTATGTLTNCTRAAGPGPPGADWSVRGTTTTPAHPCDALPEDVTCADPDNPDTGSCQDLGKTRGEDCQEIPGGDGEPGYDLTTYHWQQPTATLSGTCASGEADGTSFTQWTDGTLTIHRFQVRHTYASITMAATVVDDITLPATDITSHRQPPQTTLQTSRDQGAVTTAKLFINSADDPTCSTATGLTTASWGTTLQGFNTLPANNQQTIVP